MSAIKYLINYILNHELSHIDKEKAVIVDLGCGNGDEVQKLKSNGYTVYGCDISFKKGDYVSLLEKDKAIRKIGADYRLPFEDRFAEIVYTNQVVEHVQNIEEFFSELNRIMKPGAISVHCYPNINKIIEPHVKIPFATRIQSEWWIQAWYNLKLPNMPTGPFRKRGVEGIADYLHRKTWYRSNRELKNIAGCYFDDVWFDGGLFLDAISDYRKSRLFRSIPKGGAIFNSTWTSLMLTRKNKVVEEVRSV